MTDSDFKPFIYALADPFESEHIRYIGMATVRESRPYAHARAARRNRVKPSHLVNWIRKLQAESRDYIVIILEELPKGASRQFVGLVERCYIKYYREIGHNLCNTAEGGYGGDTGRLQTLKERAAMGAVNRGRKASVETRALMARAKRERVVTQETCDKLSDALTGRKASDTARANLSAAMMGHAVSEETCIKLKDAWTDERRVVATNRMLGNTYTLGKKASEETKAKLRIAQLARWAKIKAAQNNSDESLFAE